MISSPNDVLLNAGNYSFNFVETIRTIENKLREPFFMFSHAEYEENELFLVVKIAIPFISEISQNERTLIERMYHDKGWSRVEIHRRTSNVHDGINAYDIKLDQVINYRGIENIRHLSEARQIELIEKAREYGYPNGYVWQVKK